MQNTILLQGISPDELLKLFKEELKKENEFLQKQLLSQSANDELLSRNEACELLKIDPSTLWHWTNKGKVKAYGIANKRYYKRSELIGCLIPLNQ